MLTENEKRMAVNLAMKIDIGEIPLPAVVYIFDECPLSAHQITNFWMNFNDMTKSVAQKVATEKTRYHLEKCYTKQDAKRSLLCSMKVLWNATLNGLNKSLFGVEECITGVKQHIQE